MLQKIIRQIREAAGLNQVEFARQLGKSLATVRNYEHGHTPPPAVVEKLQALASLYGRSDLADTLNRSSAPHARWHDLLEDILDSGHSDAIQAVESNLLMFSEMVRLRRAPTKIAEKSRIG